MSTVTFRILGPFEVRVGDDILDVGGPGQQALLVRLLLDPSARLSTERLVSDLLPRAQSQDLTHARDVVHTRVLRLRRSLTEALGVPGREVLANVSQGYALRVPPEAVDAHCFRKELDGARKVARAGELESAVEGYWRAERLWRGRALAEFADLPFATVEAAHLDELRVVALEERFELELLLGRAPALVAEISQAAEQNPLRERLWGQLMLALYRSGRQAEALRAYEGLRRRLADELGVPPDPALQQLEVDILSHRPSLSTGVAPTGGKAARSGGQGDGGRPLPPLLEACAGGVPFVGRERERGQLLSAWKEVSAGARRVAVVTGEPGVGKTRLVAELARVVAGDGGVVLYGRCDEALPLPNHPIVEALSGLPPPSRPLCGDVDVVQLLQDGAEGSTPEAALFPATVGALRRAGDAPVLLVLDDLHWADRSSVLLLRFLLFSARMSRTMVVVTISDATQNVMVADLLADLRSDASVVRFALQGLNDAEAASLLEALGGQELRASGRHMAQVLRSGTMGNPLFLLEILRHLHETGVFYRTAAEGRWASTVPVDAIPLPAGVCEVVLRRVRRLSAGAQDLLRAASVLGEEFDFAAAATMTSDTSSAVDRLDEAVSAHLVAEREGGSGRYVFRHALVRRVLYESMSHARRAHLHLSAGEALQTQTRSAGGSLAPVVRHFALAAGAGGGPPAASNALHAAREARRHLAWGQAVRYLRVGLQALRVGGAAAPALRLELQLELELTVVLVRRLRFDVEGSRRAALRAAALARSVSSAQWLARAAVELGRPPAAVRAGDQWVAQLCEEALAGVGEGDDSLRACLLATLASSLAAAGHHARAIGLAAEALALARSTADNGAVAVALAARVWTLAGTDALDERLSLASELVHLARAADDHVLLVDGLRLRAPARLAAGDRRGYEADVRRLHELGWPPEEPLVLGDAANGHRPVAAPQASVAGGGLQRRHEERQQH